VFMSEAQRSALNALLFRTGDQSRDNVLVLATNRPGDLDAAVTDRIDDVIEFPLPGPQERFQLIKLYFDQYITNKKERDDKEKHKFGAFFKKEQQRIVVEGIDDELIKVAAQKTEGFSGREIAKLMASVQAAVYGRPDCILDVDLFMQIVDYKIDEHKKRIELSKSDAPVLMRDTKQ
jgi:ATPase family AAA domain-containing protein 3A/B